MRQEYVWRFDPTAGWDVDSVGAAIVSPVGQLLRLNPWVTDAEITLEEDHVLLAMTMTGHDRWRIRRRAPKLISFVLAQTRFPVSGLTHESIRTPPTLKNARYTADDGTRVFLPPQGQEPAPPVRVRCKSCHEPNHWLYRQGWKTGPEAAHPGRGH